MEELQNKAINTYLQNLEYLKKTNEPLYTKVSSLSFSIDNGEYKERYHLEYIPEDKEFDIYDEVTQTYVYNKNPKKFIKEAIQNSNFDKLNSIDLLNPTIYNTKQPYYIDPKDNILTKSTKMYHNDIFEFIQIFRKSTVYKKKKFKYFEKFIFVGSLLGTHIEPIVKKLNLKFTLIYEYNLEIFRLSLFTTNYAKLAQTTNILLCVSNEKETVEEILRQFFNYAIRSNYMIKYYCTNYNIHDYFDRILSVSSQRNPLTFSYPKMFEGFLKPTFTNIIEYPILNTIKHYNLLKDKPVLMIAAGPSFGKNIQWLKQNHKKFFTVAIGAAVKKLCDENIFPDLITNADGDEIIENQFPNEIRDKIANIPFLTSTATSQNVLEVFNKENILMWEIMGAFKQNSTTVNGYSVGEVTLSVLGILGANSIFLLGTDLALDQDTGATHIDEHQHSTKHEISEEKKELNSFMKDEAYNVASTTQTIKGNLRDRVITTTVMEKSVLAYNKNIRTMKSIDSNLSIYNLSDGAYFDNTIPTHIEEIKIPSKNNDITKDYFVNYLKEYSEVGFNDIEKNELINSLNVIDKIIDETKQIQKLKFKNYTQFVDARLPILNLINNDLKNFRRFYIDRIYLTYFVTMEPYLGFQFNEKLDNEANYVKKVKKVWCDQILKMAYQYKELVNNVTK